MSHLLKQGGIELDNITELGTVIQHGPSPTTKDSITVVDLTGISVQDLMISEGIYAHQNSLFNQK